MTAAYDLTRQARWEVEATRRAAARYHEAAAVADPETLLGGKRLLRQVVPPLVALIAEAQAEAADRLLDGGRGERAAWAWPIQLLEAEQLAMITTIAGFRAGLPVSKGNDRVELGLTHLARDIATHTRHELEYRTWVATHAAPGEGQRDVLAAFRARYPTATSRVWLRFRRRLEGEHRLDPWPTATCLQFGAKLIELLLKAAPEVFRQTNRYIGQGRRQNFLELTESAYELVNSLEARAAVARPFRYPMLIPPNPWRYTDEGNRRLPDPDVKPAHSGVPPLTHGHT